MVEARDEISQRFSMRAFLCLIVLMLCPLASPAMSCSVAASYEVPNNFELAATADTILIGTVESERGDPMEGDPTVLVRPDVFLKGEAISGTVAIPGVLEREDWTATPSDPMTLDEANPDAYAGSCSRFLYARHMKLVLFLKKYEGRLQLIDYPFARVSEDVPSIDAPWVRAVRIYVEVAALSPDARRPALEAHRAALMRVGDDESARIAADIARQLASNRLSALN
ncbi:MULTISPECIES: hypothetical protein [unclassified Sphingobium]|uniref:hypothetical protein n=1 Tax=unclassified Sphingobium TaxID=2611147 RepID=UPI002224D01E|nr:MULTISPECIES: hypothetical protein [unclassified Sphingobium]MCW2382557.1 hypothetical protein [Sphingobium sp. B2D3B]MCW2397270.1 hypothetical protein [Sphingobium sp. B2D3C]